MDGWTRVFEFVTPHAAFDRGGDILHVLKVVQDWIFKCVILKVNLGTNFGPNGPFAQAHPS